MRKSFVSKIFFVGRSRWFGVVCKMFQGFGRRSILSQVAYSVQEKKNHIAKG